MKAGLEMLNNERGWIYIDSLVGMIILGLAVVAIAGVFTQSTESTITIKNQTKATYVAYQRLSELKRYDHFGLERTNREWETSSIVQETDLQFKVNTQVLPSEEIPEEFDLGLIPVKATVEWDEFGKKRKTEIITYYYK